MNTTIRRFFLFYIFVYGGQAIYNTFLPLYFDDIGFSTIQIGMILSIGPFVAMLAQPLWGMLSDRSTSKNKVLYILLAGTGFAMLIFPLSTSYSYVLFTICLFTLFQTSIFAISDTITLESLDKMRVGSFGHIRMGGTFGFAVMSITFGFIAKNNLTAMFPIYALLMIVCLFLVYKFPNIAGHRTKGSKISFLTLFQNKKLMIFLGFNFILQITLGFYYSFFPIYFRELGGDSSLLGWSMVISSLSEVPFLLYADRIFRRVKIQTILLLSAVATCLRWLLFYWVETPLAALPIQLLHGAMFIVLTVTMATYINKEVPKELKASGQTFNGLLNLGVARIIGSLAGGAATAAVGYRQVFLYNAWISIISTILFASLLLYWARKERKTKQANV
ncbi:MFS transporter [Paenibacillus yanchengensis]|uniref:MFS transporter n=1 Tax=Paenibacillus yanchengensis TaxID=2035833 RepID=A0ABW4YLP0_9BACL